MKRLAALALLLMAPAVFGAELLKVELKVGTQLNDREPVGVADSFSLKTTSELVGWTRVSGAKEPTDITHVWLRNGKEVAWSDLPIRSSSYRTWSIRPIKDLPGKWSLRVKDVDGNVLATKDFEVK